MLHMLRLLRRRLGRWSEGAALFSLGQYLQKPNVFALPFAGLVTMIHCKAENWSNGPLFFKRQQQPEM